MHPLFHQQFINFCAYFNGNEDYFECHEVLEEYWKEIAPGERLHPLVGYVQLATGMYHWRRDNHNGAARILQKAAHNFEKNQNSSFFDFMNYELLLQYTQQAAILALNQPFKRFYLPITDAKLQTQVNNAIALLPSIDPHYLLHKHMLRDRSHILAEREAKRNARS